MTKDHDDDNDRLQKGRLPKDPSDGTAPMPKPRKKNGVRNDRFDDEPPLTDDDYREPLRTAPDPRETRVAVAVSSARWPSHPDAAFYGPLGEAARLIEPLTEADPVAVLVQLLVAFGNAVGRGPRLVMGSMRHSANLFAVVVGKSAKARKGTSWDNAREIVAGADVRWAKERIKKGLSSGEGVIWAVRDPVTVEEEVREHGKRYGKVVDHQAVVQDRGVDDKRLLIVESEFARALKVAARKENVLSTILREAWDSDVLATLTRQPYTASGVHISVIGHITKDELRRELSASDSFNGFANRFLWICATRSKVLPFGERRIGDAAAESVRQLATAVAQARGGGSEFVVSMDAACRRAWEGLYPRLSADRPGLVGSVLNRAETQVLRLALVYALADCSATVGLPHLHAALGLWQYAEESAAHVFGDALGDPVADEIIRVLRDAGELGTKREELHEHFGRNLAAARMTIALRSLAEHGLARGEKEVRAPGERGRPAERWFAVIDPSSGAGAPLSAPPPDGNYLVNLVNFVRSGDSNGVTADPFAPAPAVAVEDVL